MKNEVLKSLDLPVHNASDNMEFVGFVHSLFADDTDGEGNGSIFVANEGGAPATVMRGWFRTKR